MFTKYILNGYFHIFLTSCTVIHLKCRHATSVSCHYVQVRCAGTLTSVLTQRKRDLVLLLPWRPLFDVLVSLISEAMPRIDGKHGASGREGRGESGRIFSRGAAHQTQAESSFGPYGHRPGPVISPPGSAIQACRQGTAFLRAGRRDGDMARDGAVPPIGGRQGRRPV